MMNALCSSVGLKAGFDMALLVIGIGLHRSLAQEMRGYRDAQSRPMLRDIIDIPATVTIDEHNVNV